MQTRPPVDNVQTMSRQQVGTDPSDSFPSIRQAATYAGVAASTMHYWIETGRLTPESFPLGRDSHQYRIVKADLDVLIAVKRDKDERTRAESLQRAAAAAATDGGQLPGDLVEAVAFHDRLMRRWRRSESSHKQYRIWLGRYLRFLTEAGVAPGLEALTPQLVGQCQDWMRDRAQGKQGGIVAEATFVRCIKAFARVMCEQGVYADNPLQRQKSARAPKAQRTAYTEPELRHLLAAAADGSSPERDRALLLLLLDTGCRIGELCNADIADVDLDRGSIAFRHTKNGQPRQVLFGVDSLDGGPCLAALRAWLATRHAQPNQPLFINGGDARLTPRAAATIIARIGRAADVANAIAHRFRHTSATQFLSQRPGAEIQLRARLGHLSDGVLADYVHITQAMSHDGAQVASISSRLLTVAEGSVGPLGYASTHNPPPLMGDLADQILSRLQSGLATQLARQEERWASLDAHVTRLQVAISIALDRFGEFADTASLRPAAAPPSLTVPADLSEREYEVLQLVATGVRTTAIARRLTVTTRTVNHHVEAICAKLGVDNRIQAAMRAGALGLVEQAAKRQGWTDSLDRALAASNRTPSA